MVLQDDKTVSTFSEGEEPYRKVIITIRKAVTAIVVIINVITTVRKLWMPRNLIAMKRLTEQNKQKEHLSNQMLLFLFQVKQILTKKMKKLFASAV